MNCEEGCPVSREESVTARPKDNVPMGGRCMPVTLRLFFLPFAPKRPGGRGCRSSERSLSNEHPREEMEESKVTWSKGRLGLRDSLSRDSRAMIEHRALRRGELASSTELKEAALQGNRIEVVKSQG